MVRTRTHRHGYANCSSKHRCRPTISDDDVEEILMPIASLPPDPYRSMLQLAWTSSGAQESDKEDSNPSSPHDFDVQFDGEEPNTKGESDKAHSDTGKETSGSRSKPPKRQKTTLNSFTFEFKFSSEEANRRFRSLAKRKLNRGRAILFNDFPEAPAIQYIKTLNWDYVMGLDLPAYPSLVKLFYANASFLSSSDEISVKSYVLGNHFELTVEKVNRYLKLPNDGLKYFGIGSWCQDPSFDRRDMVQIVWDGVEQPLDRGIGLRKLPFDLFFLHKLIYVSLFSASTDSGSHSTNMNTMTCFLLCMAVKGIRVNLGYVILRYMEYCHLEEINLPYSMLLTHFFVKEGVFLSDDMKESESDKKVVNRASLQCMLIHFSEDKGWYRGTNTKTAPSKQTEGATRLRSNRAIPTSRDEAFFALTSAINKLTASVERLAEKIDTMHVPSKGCIISMCSTEKTLLIGGKYAQVAVLFHVIRLPLSVFPFAPGYSDETTLVYLFRALDSHECPSRNPLKRVVTGFVMGDFVLKKEPSTDGFSQPLVKLTKDKKIISRVACANAPSQMPAVWDITSIVRKEKIDFLSVLPQFFLRPAYEDPHQEREWKLFLNFLQKYKRVAISKMRSCELYILPPSEDSEFGLVTVLYKGKVPNTSPSPKCNGFEIAAAEISSPPRSLAGEAAMSSSELNGEKISREQRYPEVSGDYSCDLKAKAKGSSGLGSSWGPKRSFERNYVMTHPSYLKTLGQAHSSWIFGAIAELVDNSRDAKATKLEVAISRVYFKSAGKDIPMLSVIDDGHGMSRTDIQRMISFGHGQPEADDPDHIGRYGIGFKTGAMRLGKDALVLTQTGNSRSIAFLSQSLNEGKDNLEIPIVSYCRIGQYMELDTRVQDEDSAKYNLKIIKRFSPFDKYLIGEKAGIFNENGTGTQIYIWNLDEWGSTYSLEWKTGMAGGSTFHHGGIFIRSRRIRSRPGQISQMVPLDYSLKSYLEVIFLDPRMKIYVQGALVKSRPLAKTLNKTVVEKGVILGKQVQLTLGRSQLEWEQANCGIFLYWHGRLIEAYKRVGGMIHNADCGRGILGVIDVTDLMDDSNGHVWVHNNKQGFQDCEAYAELERWLGEKVDEYLDKYVDKIPLRKGNAQYKPDHEWVQCEKCRKWRMLSSDFDSKTLPIEWFCYMKPFNGRCDMPEEEVGSGLITISTKRHGFNTKDPTGRDRLPEKAASKSEAISEDMHSDSKEDVDQLPHKRQRTCPPRSCKKH